MPKLALCLVIAELSGGGNYPDIGLPVPPEGGGEYPDQGLPGGGSPAHPWFPGHLGGPRPDQGLPGGRPPHAWWGGRPINRPDQGLPRPPVFPTHPIYRPDKPVPPGTSPGAGMWVIAFVPGQGFKWVSVTPGVPEKPQPVPPDPTNPDNTLPTVPVDPDAPTATPQ
jgi:hypothetical protein